MTDERQTRRRLLYGLASSAAVGVAGCIDGRTGSPGSSGNGGFERVAVDGTTLVVELQSTDGVEQVNVVAPDGSLFAKRSVSTGATKLTFELGYDYPPGKFEIHAVEGESTQASTSLQIAPDIRITGFGMGANNMEKMPDSLGNTEKYAGYVSLENTGSGPDSLSQLLVLGDVPNPTVETKNSDSSGIFDAKEGEGTRKAVPLVSGEGTTLYTSTLPFYMEDNSTCNPRTATCRVMLHSKVRSKAYSEKYQLKYNGTAGEHTCSIKISEK